MFPWGQAQLNYWTKNKFWSQSLAHTHRSWELISPGSLGYTAARVPFIFRTQFFFLNEQSSTTWSKKKKIQKRQKYLSVLLVWHASQHKLNTHAKLVLYCSVKRSHELPSWKLKTGDYYPITPRSPRPMMQKPHHAMRILSLSQFLLRSLEDFFNNFSRTEEWWGMENLCNHVTATTLILKWFCAESSGTATN